MVILVLCLIDKTWQNILFYINHVIPWCIYLTPSVQSGIKLFDLCMNRESLTLCKQFTVMTISMLSFICYQYSGYISLKFLRNYTYVFNKLNSSTTLQCVMCCKCCKNRLYHFQRGHREFRSKWKSKESDCTRSWSN